jgi:hypothetical protein
MPLAILELNCRACEGATERGDIRFVLLKGMPPDSTSIFESNIILS